MEKEILQGEQLEKENALLANEGESKEIINNALNEGESTLGSPWGKFKDAGSLYEAYNNLQAEFTKKCQRLSVLEKANEDNASARKEAPEQNLENTAVDAKTLDIDKLVKDEKFVQEHIYSSEDVKKQVLELYLKDIASNSVPPIMTESVGGVSLVARTETPKNLDEAGKMATTLLS